MTGKARPIFQARGIGRQFAATDDLPLEFAPFSLPGDGVIALVGESGVGKTTLLNILSGIDAADTFGSDAAFTIRLRPCDPELDALDWSAYPRTCVSSIFQRGYLLENVSLAVNVAAPMALSGQDPDDGLLMDRLAAVGLRSDRDGEQRMAWRRPWQISGGQAQRVGIARALSRDPDILFADEPTSNLDESARDQVMKLLVQWREAGRTLLLVSHDLELVLDKADTIVVLVAEDAAAPGQARHVALMSYRGPRDKATLRAALSAKVGDVGHEHLEPLPAPEFGETADPPGPFKTGSAMSRLLHKLTLSEVLSRRTGRTDARFNDITSSWKPVGFGGFLRNLRRFSSWGALMAMLLSLLMMTIMMLALVGNYQRLDAVTTNPENCGLTVSPIRAAGVRLNETTLEALSGRVWREADVAKQQKKGVAPHDEATVRASSSCAEGPAAFERHDTTRVFLSQRLPGGACADKELDLSLLATEANDPILSRSLITAQAPSFDIRTGQNIAAIYASSQFQSKTSLIFLDAEFAAKMGLPLTGDAMVQVCLMRGLSEKPAFFQLAGLVDELSAVRRQPHDAMITKAAFTAFAHGKHEPMPSAVHLYFDLGGLFSDGSANALRAYLSGRYDYSEKDLSRPERLRDEARLSVISLAFLVIANALVFVITIYTNTLNFLRMNAAQFAVLRTFGLTLQAAQRQTVLTLAHVGGLALMVAAPLFGAVLLMSPLPFGEGVHITPKTILMTIGAIVIVTAALSVASAMFATWVWWRRGKLLSELIG